jgi:hypothetical protein
MCSVDAPIGAPIGVGVAVVAGRKDDHRFVVFIPKQIHPVTFPRGSCTKTDMPMSVIGAPLVPEPTKEGTETNRPCRFTKTASLSGHSSLGADRSFADEGIVRHFRSRYCCDGYYVLGGAPAAGQSPERVFGVFASRLYLLLFPLLEPTKVRFVIV